MTRRDVLLTLGAGGAWLGFARQTSVLAQQVDPGFLRMYEDAQRQRPAAISSVARIALPDEPGTPLVLRARLFDREGVEPLAGVIIFAYHTDRDGLYNRPGQTGWRLKGWARTDDLGRVEFTTIRPAPYPERNAAAHIHVAVDGPHVPRQILDSVLFAGDPLLSREQTQASDRAGAFSTIRPVVVRDGLRICEIAYRLTGAFIF